jgi:BMFP domain-containing protein YqiC
MGMFDQFKAASEMMKGMSPDQLQQLMKQAQDSKKMLEDTVRQLVEAELKKRDLVSRAEVERMIRESR